MSQIAKLEADIKSANEVVARAERAAATHSQYPSAFVTLRSAEKYRDRLMELFSQEIARQRVNACSYRVEYEDGHNPAIAGVTSAIGMFQQIYTTVYHALKNGIKKRATVSQESSDATRLNLAFTFPGSIGFMMTMECETELFPGSLVDIAMENTLQLLAAPTVEKLDEMTEKVGLPAVKLTHYWASENAKYGFGADINWQADPDQPVGIRIQPSEITHLAGMLGQYIAKERVRAVALLQHVNMFEKTFEMSVDDKRIVGSFDKAISEDRPVLLPKMYLANLIVATRVASEEDVGTTYFLESLEDFDPNAVALTRL